jgi:hypothetical protein
MPSAAYLDSSIRLLKARLNFLGTELSYIPLSWASKCRRFQHHLTSSEAAGRIAERSMEQFANLFGFTGDTARRSVQNSTSSVEALIHSSTVFASGIQNVSGEWTRYLQERVEQNLKSVDELMACRTVQDCLAVQTRMMRDNIEASLQSARRTSELSTKLADDAVKQMSDAALAPR